MVMVESNRTSQGSMWAKLMPYAAIVFLGYSAVGIPLSTLPVEVHETFGYGTTVVGVIIGLSAAVTLLTRLLAGALSDRRGPKFAVLLGLGMTALTIKRQGKPIRALPHVDCYRSAALPQVVCYRRTRAREATGWHCGSAWQDGLNFWRR